jgi:hypothetical protein
MCQGPLVSFSSLFETNCCSRDHNTFAWISTRLFARIAVASSMDQSFYSLSPDDRSLLLCSREFSHRIKSISMSSFTDTEVQNIVKCGGNNAAQKYWLAKFDVNSQSNSRLNARDRVRNFIRDCYIDRRYVTPFLYRRNLLSCLD